MKGEVLKKKTINTVTYLGSLFFKAFKTAAMPGFKLVDESVSEDMIMR
jgi:hypothetical protein